MHDDELQGLIAKYAAGLASAEEARRLDMRLRRDPGARRLFLELSNLDFAFETLAADHAFARHDAPRSSAGVGLLRVVAAVVILGFVAVASWLALIPPPLPAGPPPARAGAGTLARAVGPAEELLGRDIVGGRRYELATGAAKLVTTTGVTVLIEAPAAFSFESAAMLRLERGRLVADVPASGKGFTVVTPTGRAIDLGTRFGVEVGPSGGTEIHVFQGRVIAESLRGGRSTLGVGDAVTVSADPAPAGLARCDFRPEKFVHDERISGAVDRNAVDPAARSREALAQLREDPALVALLDFEGADLPGGRYRLVPGRWPGSRAVDFSQRGDHIGVDFGGGRVWPKLTVAAWVRLEPGGAPLRSLYHTDGWKDRAGYLHWLITEQGAMRLAVKGSQVEPGSPTKEPESTGPVPLGDGRWLHLAAVYDADARTVRFFVDGVLDHQSRLAVAPPAVLGRARVGNWTDEERVLRGSIDELVIVGRPLADDEIRGLHEAGTPGR